jgi:hypothetical protein
METLDHNPSFVMTVSFALDGQQFTALNGARNLMLDVAALQEARGQA